MKGKLRSPKPKEHQLNPNWELLRQKLIKSNGPKKQSTRSQQQKSEPESQNSILGKRKERPVTETDGSKPNPLIPSSSDSSVTDVLAMDCEMVGVSSMGNKSALGRITLVSLVTTFAHVTGFF
nr:uncharacterized protein LOC113688757 [Coffea arabica]